MVKQDSPQRASRRKVIAAVGSLAAFSAVPMAAEAKTASTEEIYKKSPN